MSNAEFKQIKVLNSILLKEVTESKDRIEELEEENQELKTEQEIIKKENENKYNRIEKLEQENQQLKIEQEKIKIENKNKNTRIKKLEEENEILKIENEEIINRNEINEKNLVHQVLSSNVSIEKLKRGNEGLRVELRNIKNNHAAKVIITENKIKERLYKCRNEKENDDCPAFFISKYAMQKHFIKHHKPYFCIPCDKDFVFKDRLARHKGWREHGMDQPNYQGSTYKDKPIKIECDYCKKERTKKNIVSHKRKCKKRPFGHTTPPRPGRGRPRKICI